MTANLRMAPPHLYRTHRLVQAGRSHVQQSAPSHHITLDSDGLIHAQLQEQFTLALTSLPPSHRGEPRPGRPRTATAMVSWRWPGRVDRWLMRLRCTSTSTRMPLSAACGSAWLMPACLAWQCAPSAGMHAALAGQPVEHWPHYLPGNWVPHCTLAEGLDKMQAARAFGLLLGYEPITATVTSAGIKDTRTGEITLLTG